MDDVKSVVGVTTQVGSRAVSISAYFRRRPNHTLTSCGTVEALIARPLHVESWTFLHPFHSFCVLLVHVLHLPNIPRFLRRKPLQLSSKKSKNAPGLIMFSSPHASTSPFKSDLRALMAAATISVIAMTASSSCGRPMSCNPTGASANSSGLSE